MSYLRGGQYALDVQVASDFPLGSSRLRSGVCCAWEFGGVGSGDCLVLFLGLFPHG